MTARALSLALLCLAGCTRPQAVSAEGALGPPPPKNVKHVVTLAPSLTDLVIALGAADRIVGVTRFDDAPEVAATTRVGGYSDPSTETIVRLRPDLVLAQPSPGNKGAVHAVADAGISVQFFKLETLADLSATTRTVGSLLARDDAAKTLESKLEAARTRAREAATKRVRKPRVVLLVGIEPLVAAGPGSFPHEILEGAGAESIVERSAQTYPRLSPERLLSQNPDAVLLVGVEHGADPAKLPAPLRERLLLLKSVGFLRPGPGVPDAFDEMTRVLDTLATRPQ